MYFQQREIFLIFMKKIRAFIKELNFLTINSQTYLDLTTQSLHQSVTHFIKGQALYLCSVSLWLSFSQGFYSFTDFFTFSYMINFSPLHFHDLYSWIFFNLLWSLIPSPLQIPSPQKSICQHSLTSRLGSLVSVFLCISSLSDRTVPDSKLSIQ